MNARGATATASSAAPVDQGGDRSDPLAHPPDHGLLMIDAEGAVRLANDQAAALFGRAVDELVGRWFGEPVLGETAELGLVQPDGGGIVVEMQATETHWNGEPVVAVSLREVPDHAAQVESLRQAIARKDTVVANITHELRNPITVITGFAETLRRHWHSIEENDRLELIERIHAMGERMGATVENLLKLSRMEAGESRVRPGEVHLSRLVFTRLFELGDRARVINVSCPGDAAVMADEDHVWEMLVNFLENAFKYGEPPVEINARTVGDWVEVRVRDHGPGVSADFVPQLFDRFSRSKDTADAADGSGLGLSITRALAQANHGDVRYEATDGGACFVISLPGVPVS